jgi:hypothetical protein
MKYEVVWRCTRRTCELSVAAVRDSEDNALKPDGTDWLLVVDLPIDRDGRGPADHLARIKRFKGDARTVVWLPTFLSERSQAEVARLVILDYLLNPNVDRLRDHAAHLPAAERAEARQVLASLQSQLRERVRLALRQAYGIGRSESTSKADGGAIEESTALELRDQFQSLARGRIGPQATSGRQPEGCDACSALSGVRIRLPGSSAFCRRQFGSDVLVEP